VSPSYLLHFQLPRYRDVVTIGSSVSAIAEISTPKSQRSVAGPQLHPLKLLHRHDDGYIAFALKEEDKGFRPSFSIKAKALDSMFPGFVEQLAKNSYVSINASYTLAFRNRTKDTGRPKHQNDNLRYLCACYCDIDHYKLGLTFYQARSAALEMFEAGILPEASMIVNSGRGMWLLWLLHDYSNPERAHLGAWNEDEFDPLMVYSQINKAIAAKLRNIGSDPISDGARYIRMPGSFRTDEERNVWWSIQGSRDSVFSYTLCEMADLLGVKIRRMLPAEVAAQKTPKAVPGRAIGQRAANENRLKAMLTLMAVRGGGFRVPHRDKGAWIYAMCLCRCKVSLGKAIQEVRAFGRECEPPLSSSECDAQTRSGYRPNQLRWPYLKIASVLDVTMAEAEVISQRIGKAFPCADGPLVALTRQDGRPKQKDLITLRRLEIQRIIAEDGFVSAARVMEQKLKTLGHEKGTYVTVLKDYEALGIVSPRTARRRVGQSLKDAQGTLLPTFEAAHA